MDYLMATPGEWALAFATNEPSRVYALVGSNKKWFIYKSDDGGFKWELVTSDARWVTNRPFYFQDIRVDPKK